MERELLTSKISRFIYNSEKKPALIPFIVGGFPDLETTEKLIELLDKKNVAAIEVGVPFSDPMADGPVIQKASKESLDNGTNIEKIFGLLNRIKARINVPIILFTYCNPVICHGAENFIKKAFEAGVSGLIIPDLPLEESEYISEICKNHNMDLIMLIAPTSDKERIKSISKNSSGFIYLVSSTGVTGARENFSGLIKDIVKEIKTHTKTPVAVGFGVSTAEHLQSIKGLNADGAIIGSAIVKLIDRYKNDKKLIIEKLSEYIDSLY